MFYRDLLILGSIVPEGLPSAPGDIRAFDINTGRQKWAFHTIPHPGELGYDTWPAEAWKYSGGANAWSGVSLDEARGLVYASTGSASYDFYGAQPRSATTSSRIRSSACAPPPASASGTSRASSTMSGTAISPRRPSLITIRHDGRQRDVVAQTAKNGRLYVLDRETGRAALSDGADPGRRRRDLPGERLSPTQVLPTLPPPFTRQQFTEDLITNRTPAAHQAVREEWLKLRKGGEFDPPSTQGTILFPGMDGGGEWGGTAFDPKSGLLYVNANEMAWKVKLAERKMPDGEPTTGKALYERYCASCHRADLQRHASGVPIARGRRHATQRGRNREHRARRAPAGCRHPRAAQRRATRDRRLRRDGRRRTRSAATRRRRST